MVKFPFIATVTGCNVAKVLRVERRGSKLVTTAIDQGPVLSTPVSRRTPQNVQLQLSL